jgi:ABC-type nitrate/sulfonate/bicarbonate transport system permease component
MFVPIMLLGILGVMLTSLVRVLETKVAPWTAAQQD